MAVAPQCADLTLPASVDIGPDVGLLDVLKPKSPLEKAAKQVREAFAQPEYRQGAMEKLLEIGTPEAYEALLKRFTFNASGSIADESEKRLLVDELVRVGEPAIEPLKKFIRNEKLIAFPIRAVVEIIGKDRARDFMVETLQGYEPLDHRTTQAKRALVIGILDVAEAEHAQVFVPYLADHDDDVQLEAIAALERLANPETAESLAKVCVGDEQAGRVQRRAAQALAELKWSVRPHYEGFHQEIKAEFLLGKKGQLVRKSEAAS